jgi:hypothetical protein
MKKHTCFFLQLRRIAGKFQTPAEVSTGAREMRGHLSLCLASCMGIRLAALSMPGTAAFLAKPAKNAECGGKTCIS